MSLGEFDFEVDCELCESKPTFGAAGNCSEDKSTCICPDGFTGRDNWLLYPTCHVNEDLAFGLQVLVIISVILGIFCSSLAVFVLSRRWNVSLFWKCAQTEISGQIVQKSYKNQSSTLNLSASDSNLGNINRSTLFSTKKSRRAAHRAWKLKRDTIIANLLFMMFALCAFVYQFPFLLRNENGERITMRDGSPWHIIAFSFALTGILSALYLLLLTWYNTLPDVTTFGHLFELNPFFIKFPNFIRILSWSMISFSFVYSLICIAIIPNVDESFYPQFALSFNLVALFYVGVFGFLQWFVTSSVMKTFQQAISNLQMSHNDKRSEKRKAMLREAILVTWVFRAVGAATMFYCVILGTIWMRMDQKYQYIIVNLVSMGPYVCTAVFPIGILWKTNGGLKPLPLQFEAPTDSDKHVISAPSSKNVGFLK